MSTWYRSRWQAIDPVEVERETDSSVFINGRRHNKITSYECYFPTWEAAKEHLLQEHELKVLDARRRLQDASDKLGNMKGLKKP
jgi:hypothetical protein